jgi:hypothetical protein
MAILEYSVQKQDWLRGVARHNGAAAGHTCSPHIASPGPWEAAVQEVLSFDQLKDDWDGYGAEKPSPQVIESAIGLADCFIADGVEPPHRVAPGVAGSVIFEWQQTDGTYVTVEVDAPLHAEVMVVQPGKPTQQWTLPSA